MICASTSLAPVGTSISIRRISTGLAKEGALFTKAFHAGATRGVEGPLVLGGAQGPDQRDILVPEPWPVDAVRMLPHAHHPFALPPNGIVLAGPEPRCGAQCALWLPSHQL